MVSGQISSKITWSEFSIFIAFSHPLYMLIIMYLFPSDDGDYVCVAINTGAPGITFNVSSQVAQISVQCKQCLSLLMYVYIKPQIRHLSPSPLHLSLLIKLILPTSLVIYLVYPDQPLTGLMAPLSFPSPHLPYTQSPILLILIILLVSSLYSPPRGQIWAPILVLLAMESII